MTLCKELTENSPKIINNNDEAYEQLLPYVTGMAGKYRDDSELVAQEAWFRVFDHLAEHGPTPLPQLVTIAKFAMIDEINEHNSHGMRPVRSKFPRPERQYPDFLGGTNVGGFDHPSYTDLDTTITVSEVREELLSIATTDDERKLIEAGVEVLAAYDEDNKSPLGQVSDLARRTGLSRRQVEAARDSLQRKLKARINHDS